MTDSDDKDASRDTETEADDSVISDDEQSSEAVDFDEYPVGTSPAEVMETVDSVDDGALSDIFSKYEPDEFTNFVNDLVREYQTAKKRKYWYNLSLVGVSIVLVLLLFGGLLWFTLETNTSGSALIFFAGTLSGYFMRLAAELT
jgi:hypothetical protein